MSTSDSSQPVVIRGHRISDVFQRSEVRFEAPKGKVGWEAPATLPLKLGAP